MVVPTYNERENIAPLLQRLSNLALEDLHVLFVDDSSPDGTAEIAEACAQELGQIHVLRRPVKSGLGSAYRSGFAWGIDQGYEILCQMDADLSHEPDFAAKLWRARTQADIVIASRYTRGGISYTSVVRNVLSRMLNLVLRRVLSMPVRDLSSGFRLYRREAVAGLAIEGHNFEALEEILVKAYARGYSIFEVPFTYFPRESGRSHARLIRFGWDLARSALKLWWVRNSVASADYDDRAFYSIIPVQRYWQRRRHRIATFWVRGSSRILDVGCGSSLIIQSLNNAVGMDVSMGKMRFLRGRGIPLVRASAFTLPFKDDSFDCVISSQVIEHIPFDEALFTEMHRVLRTGGKLVIGTPDYATIGWNIIEPLYGLLIPGGYHDEHITHYTRQSLTDVLVRHGFSHEETAYIARSELIMRFRKTVATPVAADKPPAACAMGAT